MPAAKKKPAKKLDPNKLFVIQTISREAIAEQLNMARQEFLDDEEEATNDIKPFTPNDPRLTDKVCQQFANDLFDATTETEINLADESMWAVAKEFIFKF